MINIAICDDENEFASELKENMELICDELHITYKIEIYSNGFDLLEKQDKTEAFDVVFLDIDMPEISGMDTAGKLFEQNKYQLVVFITSHDELVFEALKLQPLNFIRKQAYKQDLPAVMKNISDKVSKNERSHVFKYNGSPIKIKLDSIVLISSCKHTITVNCLDGKSVVVTDTIQNLEQKFSSFGFIKVNSGCVVNIKFIQTIETDSIILDNGESVPVSRSQMAFVKEKFRMYLR